MNDLHDLRYQRYCECGDLADEHELQGACAVDDCPCAGFCAQSGQDEGGEA